MKNTFASLFLFCLLFCAAPSSAATLDINAGDSGALALNGVTDEGNGREKVFTTYDGTLAANTTVTFSFSMSDGSALTANNGFVLHGYANTYTVPNFSYTGADGSTNYNVGVSATLNAYGANSSTTGSSWGGYNEANGAYVSYNPVTALLVSVDLTSGTITLSNLADFAVWYQAVLDTELFTNGGTLLASYQTSPVPLPAALPLFGAGLLGLGWFGKKRMRTA